MAKRRLIIATRESPLALWQSESIKALLLQHYPSLSIELLGITTQGDKRLDVSLTTIGGKGLFVKELEDALLDGRADIAVHSMKDVPMELPDGLCLPVIGRREDPRDAFVSHQYRSIYELPMGAVVGTSSARRQAQIKTLRPDLTMRDLRGNVHTRLKRLDEGNFDAIILAAAGLKRMQLSGRIRSYLSIDEDLPAAGQGALGIECRERDESVLKVISPLNDIISAQCVSAERALCRHLGGGCQVPVAAYAHVHHSMLSLKGLVANLKGTRIVRSTVTGKQESAETIGKRAAEELLQQGAANILSEFYER